MWIPASLVPFMIEAVQSEIDEAGDGDDGAYDPNDLVILNLFVLSVLQESLDHGFDSTQMLDKGFGLLFGLLPAHLADHAAKLSPQQHQTLSSLLSRPCTDWWTAEPSGAV